MKKSNQLSRNEMRNVKGGVFTPTCSAVQCFGHLGASGICSQATLPGDIHHCPCVVNGLWDGVSVCTVGGGQP